MTSNIAGAGPTPDGGAGRLGRVRAGMDDRLARAGLVGELRRDAALAVLVLVVSIALVGIVLVAPGLAGVPLSATATATVLAVVSAQALLLCLRRVRPVLCLLTIAALQVVLTGVLPVDGTLRGLATLVAAYSCGAWLEGRRAVAVVLGAAALEGAGSVAVRSVHPAAVLDPAVVGSPGVLLAGQVVSGLVVYVAAVAVGAYAATRRRYVELLRLRAAEAIAAQQARADAAITSERSRMARELHDVAAHHLSGMVVQAAVVERLIDRDPAAAKEAASLVRRQGRATLDDLRLVVGTLREPAGHEGGTPLPGLAALEGLVDAARTLGTTVEVTRVGDPRELTPLADITFHRVAQEALANARDHAPGAVVRVRLRFASSEVTLEVVNGAGATTEHAQDPEPGRGFGLAGMAERAEMVGARLVAGPIPTGGWRIVLTLPGDGCEPGTAS